METLHEQEDCTCGASYSRYRSLLIPLLEVIKLLLKSRIRPPTAMLTNFSLKYRSRGKWIFVPTDQCERKGRRIIKYFSGFTFPDYCYHYRAGGHVAALHAHLENHLFFKIDIQNFYYSIARMRVTSRPSLAPVSRR